MKIYPADDTIIIECLYEERQVPKDWGVKGALKEG